MRKVLAFAALIFAALSPLAAVGAKENARPEQVLQVAAIKGPTGIGMIRLFADKPLLAEGVTTEYTAYGSPDPIVPRMIRGEIDIAALPANLAVNLYNRGAAYRLAGIIGNGVLYLVSTDHSVNSIESLKGKTVQNVNKGSTPEFLVRHILEKKGLARDVEVQFRYANAELAQLLAAGRESLAILPEPFASIALRAQPRARIAVDFQQEWAAIHPENPAYPMTVLVAKKSLYEERPAALAAFVEEYKKSQSWVLAHPREAGILAEKLEFGINSSDAEAAIPRCNLVFTGAREARPLVEEFLAVFLDFAPEAIGGKLPDDGFYP